MAATEDARRIDLEQAMLDPGSVFATPEEVAAHAGLTVRQKCEILRRWEQDASAVCVAIEEGMPDGNADLVHRILVLLERLGAAVDVEHVGPSKQHGLRD